MIGLAHIAGRYPNPVITMNPPEVAGTAYDQDGLDHWIGYQIAAQLVNSRSEIPHAGLFHAPDQDAIWSIVRQLVRPTVSIPVRDERMKDELYRQAQKTLRSSKLDAEISVMDEQDIGSSTQGDSSSCYLWFLLPAARSASPIGEK